MAASRQLPSSLQWKQLKATQRSYDLVSGDKPLATLRFIKLIGTLAEAQVEGAAYTFKRTGFLRPQITIRKAPFEQDIGVVDVSWMGTGVVRLDSGRRYAFSRPSVWGGKWEILDDNDEVLATIKMSRALLRYEAEVAVTEKGSKSGDLSLLLVVHYYLVMLIQQEGAAAAAGSS